MLPKAILLSGQGTNFSFRFGPKLFDFTPDKGERIPVAVALALQKQVMPGGKPLFRIEDMPEIVEHVSDERAVPKPEQVVGLQQLRL